MSEMEEYLPPDQFEGLIAAFPVIKKVIFKRLPKTEMIENEDLAQQVKLGLLVWKRNRPQTSYSLTDWLKIAHCAARNEVINHFRGKMPNPVSMDGMDEEKLCHLAQDKTFTTRLEGNTTMELHLLVSRIWEVIKTQTFFENYALLLKNDELTSHLIFYRGCRIKELAAQLQLTETELDGIIKQLPFSSPEIASFLAERFQLTTTPAAVRKARQRATEKLQTAIEEPIKSKENGNSSRPGKT